MISRLNMLLKEKISPHTTRSVFLLFLIFVTLVWTIATSVKGLEFKLSWPLAAIAILLCWMLAGSRMPAWLATLVVLPLGWGLVLIRVGRLESIFYGIFDSGTPSGAEFLASIINIIGKMGILTNRFLLWTKTFGSGSPNYDPVTLSLVWSAVVWLVAAWASWVVRRHNHPPLAMTPAILILAYSLEFIGSKPTALLPIVGATVALMVVGTHQTQAEYWRKSGIRFSQLITKNSMWAATLLSLGLVLTAAFTPSISIKQITDFVRETTSDVEEKDIGQSLGLEQQSEDGKNDPFGSGTGKALGVEEEAGMPRSYLIGSTPEQTQRVMMRVTVKDPNRPEMIGEIGAPTYYFRSLTYDQYNGQGWSSKDTYSEIYDAGAQLKEANLQNQRLVELNFIMGEDTSGMAFSTGAFLSANLEYRAVWRDNPEISPRNDIFGAVIGDSRVYSVNSLLPVYSEEDLRTASLNYPDWVKDKYLRLPSNVTERVILLAQELTATEPTPYDRAAAIEAYVRQFPYTLDLPPRPLGRDIADYFLFSLKKGYCDYYATSMVVLARAAGLPARMVVGYVGNHYDADKGEYVVTAEQAHSWAEIYFPEYGWIQFEPTASQNTIPRPQTSPEIVVDITGEAESAPNYSNIRLLTLGQLLAPIFSGLLIAALAWNLVDLTKLLSSKPQAAFEDIYKRLRKFGKNVNINAQDKETPFEYMQSIAPTLEKLSRGDFLENYVSTTPQEFSAMINRCVESFYSPAQPNREDKLRMIWAYLRLRRKLVLTRLFHRFPRLQGRGRRYYSPH